jgi:23S rRNA pseudouridine2605 synthase
LSTHRDPAGRTRVIDLVPNGDRYFTVGRLDRSSEGLILITNDGDLANGLAHPRYGVVKIYRVEVAGVPDHEALRQLRDGIHLAEGLVKAGEVRVVQKRRQSTLLEFQLREGMNREIRRMAARIGHKVLSLRRIALGPLRLGELPIGAYRELTRDEIARLRGAIGRSEFRPPKRGRHRSRRPGGPPPGGAGASDKPPTWPRKKKTARWRRPR